VVTRQLYRSSAGQGKFTGQRPTFYTIRYDSVYFTCSKNLAVGRLVSHTERTKKLKCETKNKLISVIPLSHATS